VIKGVVGIGFVLTFHTAIVLATVTFPILAPTVSASFEIDPHYVGYFSTLVFASALVVSNGTADIIRRLGSIRAAAIALALASSGLFLLAVSNSVVTLILGALILGAAHGPVSPIGSRLLMRVTQGFRPNFVFSIKQSSVAIGGAVAGALLPVLAISFGWRAAVVAVACTAVAIMITAWPVQSYLGDDADHTATFRFHGLAGPARYLLSDSSLRSFAFSMFAFSAAQLGIMSVYVTFLWSRIDLSPEGAAAMLAIALAVSIAGRLAWGWVADYGSPTAILAGHAGSGCLALVALLGLTPETPIVACVVITVILGLGVLSWSGVFQAEIARRGALYGGDQAIVTVTAGMMAFGYLGGMLGPGVLSLSAVTFGSYGPGTLLVALALAISTVLLIRQWRETPRTMTAGPPE